MTDRRTVAAAILYLAALAACLIIPCLSGCEMARRIDSLIWTPPAAPSTPTQPGQPPAPAQAPPIIDGIAAVLAALGFGGMGKWIYSTRQAANGSLTALADRINKLEAIQQARKEP